MTIHDRRYTQPAGALPAPGRGRRRDGRAGTGGAGGCGEVAVGCSGPPACPATGPCPARLRIAPLLTADQEAAQLALGVGVGWMAQLVPFHRSASSVRRPLA